MKSQKKPIVSGCQDDVGKFEDVKFGSYVAQNASKTVILT